MARWLKVKGNASPDDPSLQEYWEKRNTSNGKKYKAQGSKYDSCRRQAQQVGKQQNWKCPVCGNHLFMDEEIETHHIVPIAKGGTDYPENLMHLHAACHIHVALAKSVEPVADIRKLRLLEATGTFKTKNC